MQEEVQSADDDNFTSMDLSTSGANGAIGVTLEDLVAVYSGYPVRISGMPLVACFMPGQSPLSKDALLSLGLNASAMQMLARKSAIVQRQLRVVTDEREMQSCMARYFPAFGYLSSPVQSEKFTPCF